MASLRITHHAAARLHHRGLDVEIVRHVVEHPEAAAFVRPGRVVLQASVVFGSPPKAYLVRVFLDVDRSPMDLVTACRTSKFDKYRSRGP